ncbi:MAG TPA: alpha/beta hydrolase [Acetobacteraceae bacterium]|jgi:acetyl esterase/lipase|nr:alpha/beta hydrolase [Acetobacteraceae bacterium]
MASLRAHLFVRFMRWQVKRRVGRAIDIAAIRRTLDRPYRQRTPRGISIRRGEGPVPGEWVTAADADPAPVLLYLHGGAFFACSPRSHRPVTTAMARASGVRLFVPEYRLAPEHRFPAAIDDVVACCDWLAAGGHRIAALAGDSAGGTLVLSTLLRLRDSGRSLPPCAIAFSPLTDLAATGASLAENDAKDAMFFGSDVHRLADVYLAAGGDPRDPLASPLYADLAGLPPLMLHVGADEVLRDDTLRFAARAREAGVDVTLKVWPVVPHAWQLMGALLPEGRRSVTEAARFISDHASWPLPSAERVG